MGVEDYRVAIIGAGPAGAIALEHFLKQGFRNIAVIERRPVVGGTWSLDEVIGVSNKTGLPTEPSYSPSIPTNVEQGTRSRPIVSGVKPEEDTQVYEGSLYPQVETNVTADLMAFTSKPFSDTRPADTFERFGVDDAFRSHEVVREYVVEYFDSREQYLLLNTAVEKAYKTSPEKPWSLVLHQGDKWWTEEFDFLYTSAGRFNTPRIPEIPGLREAAAQLPKRTIIHTKSFRGPEEFEGKRNVLLVGASFSNSDVAHLIKESVQLPIHLSLRGIEEYNVQNFTQPWIVAHDGIEKISINSSGHSIDVVFTDGEVLEGVEKLVLGTGYLFSYPFLEEYTNKVGFPIVSADGGQTRNLYWFTWWAADPTLAVSSAINEGITWRVMEAQAKASAFLWSGKNRLPSTEEAVLWEADRRTATGPRLFQRWHPHYDVLFHGLARTSTGEPQFPGEPEVDYLTYVGKVENSLGLKGKWYSRLASESLSAHPEWKDQFERTAAFLKARERPFSAPFKVTEANKL